MISQAQIDRGGSKLEITRLLLETGADIPMPRSAWHYYGDDLAPLQAAFAQMRKPVIVRGSHPNDYHGFIDVIPTIGDVRSSSELEDAVKHIEKSMRSKAVRIHCDDWEQPFLPVAHILLQEQSPSRFHGSMLRHPHTKKLLVQYEEEFDNWNDRQVISRAVMGRDIQVIDWAGITIDELREVKRLYEHLEASGVLDPEWSYQVEFGLRPLLFFQARPFKKYEKQRQWHLPGNWELPRIHADLAFGITPKEGIEVRCKARHECLLTDRTPSYPYAMIVPKRFDYSRGSPDINRRMGELLAFSTPHPPFQLHGQYRFVKKANVSLIGSICNVTSRPDPETSDRIRSSADYSKYDIFRESRVFSNGQQAVIIPAKYCK